MRQHFTSDKRLDAAVFQQWHLLCVPQIAIRLILDDKGLTL